MRGDWDRRGDENHRLHIAAGHATSEEAFLASGEKDLVDFALDGIDLDPAASALEIGCGVGRLLLPLASRVAVVQGVDISSVMIEKSKGYTANAANIRTSVTDGTLGHVPDCSLDFVFSYIVFQHIPDRVPIRTYTEEAARVLKPGGVFRFQVDGRWWWSHEGGGPDTYDGVKFSPGDVRDLLAGLPLEIVDEWGAGGHYHCVTARKKGEGAAVRVRTRVWDMPLFTSLLSRLGSGDPERDAAGIRQGSDTLHPHLKRLEHRLAGAKDTAFIAESYRALLGREPDEDGRAFHAAVLRRNLEDRAALLDTLVTSRDFQDLVRPFVPALPFDVAWDILGRLGEPPRAAGYFELVDIVARCLDGRTPADAIEFGYRTVLGFSPDEAARRHHEASISSRPDGTRLFVRKLLLSRKTPPPPAPEDPGMQLLPGESAPGETSLAVEVLVEGRSLDDRAFVRLAYERILLRPADKGGEEFYFWKIVEGELSRAALLRVLLSSGERRGA